MEMKTKNLMVSFVATAIVLLLANMASATFTGDLISSGDVKIDGVLVTTTSEIGVIADDTIVVQVFFTSQQNATDVRVKAEIEGDKVDVEERTNSFDAEQGKTYSKTLKLKIPSELKDTLSDEIILNIKVWNGDFKSEWEGISLRVQRPSYNPVIKSIVVPNSIEAGDNIPVDIVVKNVGYNDLNDLFVTAKISALGIEKTTYFGDLIPLQEGDCASDEICDASAVNENDEDTMQGRIYLKIPFDVQPGTYTIEVVAANDDATMSKVKQVVIANDFEANIFTSGNDLWIVNPTDKVVGYKIVPGTGASVSENVVFVPAGSSKVVKVSGEGDFNVNIFTISGQLVSTVSFSGEKSSTTATNSVVILTVILAIIFLVLLVVLIVLMTKKPEKTNDFGESYY